MRLFGRLPLERVALSMTGRRPKTLNSSGRPEPARPMSQLGRLEPFARGRGARWSRPTREWSPGGKRSFAAIYPNDRLTPITSSNHMMRSSCHPPSTVRRRQPFAHDPPRQSRICCNTQSRARSRSTRALTPGVGRLRTRNRALSEGPRCQGRGPTGPGLRCRSLTPRAGHGCQRCGSARALKRPRVDYPA